MDGGTREQNYVAYQQAPINEAINPTAPPLAPHSGYQDKPPSYDEATSSKPNYPKQPGLPTKGDYDVPPEYAPGVQYVPG